MSAELLQTLLETTLAGSAAILLVLALRAPMASRFGAHEGYLLWVLVPLSMLAVMLPPRVVETIVASPGAVGAIAAEPTVLPVSPSSSWPMAVLITWMTGAMLMLAWQALQQRRFVYSLGPLRKRAGFHQAARSPGLPAVVGAVSPRLILPPDFRSRYSRAERRLVLHHERVHLCRGDLAINLFVLLLRCLYWFNPLFVLASRRFRQDQELACDQSVIARYPHERRTYGDAMLKTHLASQALPLGCHWNGNHPLKERIAMLKRPTLTRRQRWLGALVATTLAVASGFAAWAAQPENVVARAASGPLYRVQLQLHVDGETSRMEVVTPAAVPFAVATDSPRGRSWRGEFTLQPEQRRDHVRLSGTISESGKPVSTPVMVMALGKPANLKVGETGAASAFSIDVVATVVPPPPPAAPDAPPASVRGAQFAPVPPVYPSAAAKNHQSGSVVMKVLVGEDGKVKDAVVERSEPAGVFDEASLEAVRNWRFTPAMENGKPVEGWVRVPIDFQAPPPSPPAPPAMDANAYNWSVVDTEVTNISEMVCDAMRTDAQQPNRVHCGKRKADAAK
jgi:bla regulator protein blaR1